MDSLVSILLIVVVAFVVVILGWWLLIASEGVYLGRRVVIWLYDVFASRYDAIKEFDPVTDHAYLAQPLMERLAPERAPLVLDVATGTGRLPLALMRHTHFAGHIEALDASAEMLHVAVQKLAGLPHIHIIRADASQLPFTAASFDVVTCLEALEFMPKPEVVVRELCRVLRPGGILITTHRRTGKWMPGKIISPARLNDLLTECGMRDIEFDIWQIDYDLVWARKRRA